MTVRKFTVQRETIGSDAFGEDCPPIRRVAGLAVFANPFAGRFERDLSPLFDLSQRSLRTKQEQFSRRMLDDREHVPEADYLSCLNPEQRRAVLYGGGTPSWPLLIIAGAGTGKKRVGARFDHVLIDEYQDTNRLQAQILIGLKPEGRGLTVVGDDAQSIYSFRAAEVRSIRRSSRRRQRS